MSEKLKCATNHLSAKAIWGALNSAGRLEWLSELQKQTHNALNEVGYTSDYATYAPSVAKKMKKAIQMPVSELTALNLALRSRTLAEGLAHLARVEKSGAKITKAK